MKIFRLLILCLTLGLYLGSGQTTKAASNLRRISKDPYRNTSSQHRTLVEPDTFSFGSTVVAAFQAGRFYDGGASNIGWATSTDNGASWTHGVLPDTTIYAGGKFPRISDPSVAYDAKHDAWLVGALAIGNNGQTLVVSRSLNGGLVWQNPVSVSGADSGYDKTWITCDNGASSPYRGNCYLMWDDAGAGGLVLASTSSDGGAGWSAPVTIAGTSGVGVQPLSQPNGTLIVPYFGFDGGMYSVRSINGGASWQTPHLITRIADHTVAGNLRSEALPSAEIDGSGKIYLVWQDCRFIKQCRANDLVLTTSDDGVTWSPVKRIPLDGKKSGVDHFIPGIAADPNTSGVTAHLALTYYYYDRTACSTATCQLNVAYSTSTNGGATWSKPTKLAGPMQLTWLPDTSLGYMVGDYISTSFLNGDAMPVFAVARAPLNGYRESMFAPKSGLPVLGGSSSATTPRIWSLSSGQPTRVPFTLP